MEPKKYKVMLNIAGDLYALLCVFSIAVGLMYATGQHELNTIELSESMPEKLSDPEALQRFTVLMGWVTSAVGIAQGITSYALFRKRGKVNYCVALGFTVFSLCSVGYKIIGHFSLFALTKTIAYVTILVVLLLPGSREVFWR